MRESAPESPESVLESPESVAESVAENVSVGIGRKCGWVGKVGK